MHGMRVCGGNDIGTGRVHLRVNGKRGGIHRISAFHHLATMIDENQIRGANLSEMHAERVDPEVIPPLRITRGDMTRDALVKSEQREETKCRGQPLFPMAALLFCRGKSWRGRKMKNVGRCCA